MVEESKVTAPESVEPVEEDAGLPFARAEIYRLLRASVGDSKIIRSSVKEEMNIFLGEIAQRIGKKLAESKYTTVELADFRKAVDAYQNIDDLQYERQRILTSLEQIKMTCDSLARDVSKKFGPSEDVRVVGKLNSDVAGQEKKA